MALIGLDRRPFVDQGTAAGDKDLAAMNFLEKKLKEKTDRNLQDTIELAILTLQNVRLISLSPFLNFQKNARRLAPLLISIG